MPRVCWGGREVCGEDGKTLSEAVHPAPHQSHREDLGGLLFLRNSFLERVLWESGRQPGLHRISFR